MNKIQQIQTILGVDADGIWGPKSAQALFHLLNIKSPELEWKKVKATSFADPDDIRRFEECKRRGGSDQECFKVGDNGVGKWGSRTVAGSGPCCALPPEEWRQLSAPNRHPVVVRHAGQAIVCELRDTMPARSNIKNGAGIDLNPDACLALGISIPAEAMVEWRFA